MTAITPPNGSVGPPRTDIERLVALYNTGRLREAETKARKLAKRFPQALMIFEILGAALTGQNKFVDAVQCFRKIVQLNPDHPEAHYNLGVALQQAGQLDAAVTSYRNNLMLRPGNPVALINLGLALSELGQLDEAVTAFRETIKTDPDRADAYNNLGITLKKSDRIDEAVAAFRKALAIQPTYAEVHNNLGNALHALGQCNDAIDCYDKALAINPNYAEAHTNKGKTLLGLKRPEEARASYREAVRIDSQSADIRNDLAECLRDLNELTEAEKNCRRAITLRPDFAEAHATLASILHKQGNLEAAIASYKEALRISPDLLVVHCRLGELYERLNRPERARECIRNALGIDAKNPSASLTWARLLKREGNFKQAIQTLETIVGQDCPEGVLLPVHSELGKLYDQLKNSEKAFHHFSTANELQAHSVSAAPFDKNTFMDEVDLVTEFVANGRLRSWVHQATEDDFQPPTFVVGFPRSGTTLLDQILDSHPAIQVMEEKPILEDVSAEIAGDLASCLAALDDLSVGEIETLRRAYFRKTERHVSLQAGLALIDKYPLNIIQLPLIAKLFPTAKVILCLRHPCDVVLSNFMQLYEINDAMANFFSLSDAARCYVRVMGLWRGCAADLPLSYHTVRYESLISDFDDEVARVLKFLGVGWDDAVLEYAEHAKGRVIRTPSYQAVTESINARAKYRWLRYQDQLAPVVDDLSPFIRAFGYANNERAVVGQ